MESVSVLGQNKFDAEEAYVWRVWNDDNLMIGSVDMSPINLNVPSYEIGYWLRSDQTGQGLATEFVSAAIGIARDTFLAERLEARCDVRNERSCRLVERLGFVCEGIARYENRDAAGRLCDTRIYGFLPKEC